jgi:putative DNA primase/helicase
MSSTDSKIKREPTSETVRAALDSIPPSIERETWVRVGMALKSFYGDGGFDLFDAWSKGSDKYKAREMGPLWRKWKEVGGVAVGTLFRVAQAHGFDLAAQYAKEAAAEGSGRAPAASTLTAEDRERIERERRERDERARIEREREQAEAASASRQRWEAAATSGRSAYLERKGVEANGCRFEPDGTVLVPMYDPSGVLWSVQSIAPSGDKRFPRGGRVKGLAYWLGKLEGAEVVVLCEGFATGATLHQATGLPVAVAFNAGNLVEVARDWQARHQAARWLIASDDDRGTEASTGKNPGREAAARAAQILGGLVVLPEGLPEGGSDFNDLARAFGVERVAELVEAAMAKAAPRSVQSVASEPIGQAQEQAQDGPESNGKGRRKGRRPGGRGGAASGSGEVSGGDGRDDRSDPFILTDDGVYYSVFRDGAYVPAKVCAPIEVVGESRNMDGFGWGKLVRFTNRDGERREWVIPAELFAGDGVELRKTLAGLGLWITPTNALRGRLVEYFETRNVQARVRTVAATGWCGRVFVLPGESIGESAEPIVYHAPGDPGLRLEQRGDLAGWRRGVAKLAEGNSRLMFAVSLAFAAPLLALSAEKNGGFHFRGTSQDGKTTALSMAASVFSAPSYVRKWRATDNAVEGVAALHSDLPLLLDELHQCPPKIVGDVAYLLAEGQGKARGDRSGGLRSILRWRTLFLSTGETGLVEYMETAGIKTTAGQEMRFAEIKASPEGGHGVFENLHGEPSGEAFALRLRDAVSSEYGTAGRTWLEWLVANADEATEEVQRRVRDLGAEWTPKGAAGQVASVARRFALVAAAGEMATRAGITGWAKGAATAAVFVCFSAWIEARGGVGRAEERELLRRLRSFLQANEHRFEWWERAHDDRSPKTLNRAGFRKRFYMGEAIESDSDVQRHFGERAPGREAAQEITTDVYVFVETFRSEVVQDSDVQFAHRVLISRGILKTERNGTTVRPYRRERLPGSEKGSRSTVYVITSEGRAALDDALATMGG